MMNKNIKRITLFLIGIVFLLQGCSFKNRATENEYYINIEKEKEKLYIGMDKKDIKKLLDKKIDYIEKEGCAKSYITRQYIYKDYIIWTKKEEKNEKVVKIIVNNDSIKTEKEIKVGDKIDKAKKLYGDDYLEEEGKIKYEKPKVNIYFYISDDRIISIEYLSKHFK